MAAAEVVKNGLNFGYITEDTRQLLGFWPDPLERWGKLWVKQV